MTFRELRKRVGLTQDQLAAKARITQATISAIERGERPTPAYATVAKLAKAMSTTPEALAKIIASTPDRRLETARVA